jgi:hypothetical protein
MNVLHIYKDYYPVLGGIENHVRVLAEAGAARGHEVTVLVAHTARQTSVETVNGVRVIRAARWMTLASTPIVLPVCTSRSPQRGSYLHFRTHRVRLRTGCCIPPGARLFLSRRCDTAGQSVALVHAADEAGAQTRRRYHRRQSTYENSLYSRSASQGAIVPWPPTHGLRATAAAAGISA